MTSDERGLQVANHGCRYTLSLDMRMLGGRKAESNKKLGNVIAASSNGDWEYRFGGQLTYLYR